MWIIPDWIAVTFGVRDNARAADHGVLRLVCVAKEPKICGLELGSELPS